MIRDGGVEMSEPGLEPGLESDGGEETFCAVSAAIEILQEKWVLSIVRALLEGPRGFNDLGRTAGGCNPTTLSQRLDRLEALGIVEKTVQSYMPRTLYTLTGAGVALETVIHAIDEWGRRYLTPDPSTGEPPAVPPTRR